MRDERLETTWPARLPMRVLGGDGAGDGDGHGGASVARLLGRMRRSAFQGRKLGEAFETWKWMIDSGTLSGVGLAGSLASAGLAPRVAWLVERGYVDVLVSTSANATEDLLEARGARVLQVDPDHVDDEALWRQGFYRFYDHAVSARAGSSARACAARSPPCARASGCRSSCRRRPTGRSPRATARPPARGRS